MRRREFITLLVTAAAWPLVARAEKAPIRIGFLASGTAGSLVSASTIDAIKQGLSDNGLFEGRDYVLEARFAAGNYERFPEFARELAQGGARMILANTIASVRAAQNVIPPVPVIMLAINDPVGTGLVASLARPGGYTTGTGTLNEDLTSKMLELQHEVAAISTGGRRVGFLYSRKLAPSNLGLLQQYLPIPDLSKCSKNPLFDHLVGASKQHRRHLDADVIARSDKQLPPGSAIGHQTAKFRVDRTGSNNGRYRRQWQYVGVARREKGFS
jgi:hypothetical protein